MRFETMAEARAAGYVAARDWYCDYMGFRLYASDRTQRGETFYLRASAAADPTWGIDSPGHYTPPGFEGSALQEKTFGRSEAVKIGDVRNNMRQLGAYVAMFDPATITAAVATFREWVDQFYRANPEAVEWEARRAGIENDPSEWLTRFGQALYGPRWQSDLARDLGVADRTVRAWVAGDRRPQPGIWSDLGRLVIERRDALGALLIVENPR